MIVCVCRNISDSEAETMSAEEFTSDMQCGMCLDWFVRLNN